MKYKTYKQLFKAYKSGALTKENPLHMDNDWCGVYIYGPNDDPDEAPDTQVFEGNGECDITEILEAISIPVEHV